jgi:hypothetical protein
LFAIGTTHPLTMLHDSSNHRPDFEALQKQLSRMGADHVLTYDDLLDKNLRTRIKEWTGGKVWNVFLSHLTAIHEWRITANSSWPQLYWRQRNNVNGGSVGTQCSSRFVRRNVEATALLADIVVHFQEPDKSWILAESMVH